MTMAFRRFIDLYIFGWLELNLETNKIEMLTAGTAGAPSVQAKDAPVSCKEMRWIFS